MVLGVQLLSAQADATAGLNPIGTIIRQSQGDYTQAQILTLTS